MAFDRYINLMDLSNNKQQIKAFTTRTLFVITLWLVQNLVQLKQVNLNKKRNHPA